MLILKINKIEIPFIEGQVLPAFNTNFPANLAISGASDRERLSFSTAQGKWDIAVKNNGEFEFVINSPCNLRFNLSPTQKPIPPSQIELKLISSSSSSVNPIGPEGYIFIAKENQTYDFGNQIVDVAYGAKDKFLYKKNITGKFTFSNITFGSDPILNTFKFGFYKTPLSSSSSSSVLRSNVIHCFQPGDIIDISHASSIQLAKQTAINPGLRLWDTLNDQLDSLMPWGYNGVKRSISCANAGISSLLTLQPKEGSPNFNIPTNPSVITAAGEKLAQQLETLGLPKSTRIQIINECNLSHYWPRGDWKSAYLWAAIFAQPIRAKGWKVGTPSRTGTLESWTNETAKFIIDNNLSKSFDAFDWHYYGGWVSGTEAALKAHRKFCDELRIEAWSSECGPQLAAGVNIFQQQIPKIVPLFKEYLDLFSFWLLTPIVKFPGHSALYNSNGSPTSLLSLYQNAIR